MSRAAVALGTLSAATSLIGYLAIPRLVDILRDKSGRQDLPIWMSVVLSIAGCAALAAAPLAQTAVAFLVLEGMGTPLLVGSAILTITSLPIIAPPRMRAVLTSLYLLMSSAVTSTVAPTLAAVLSTYVFAFRGAQSLATGAAAVAAVTPFLTVTLLLISRRDFAAAMTHHLGRTEERS